MLKRSLITILPALFLGMTLAPRATANDDVGAEFFEKQVRPILVARCFECHSGQAAKLKGGLKVDSLAAILKGGDTGPAVVPGKLKESLLIDAINYGDLYQMPPKGKLPPEEIATLTKWVEMGAPWPAARSQASGIRGQAEEKFDLAKRKAEHWCWQPIRRVVPPAVKNEAWLSSAAGDIDRFVLAKLEEKGLSPAPPADPRALLRRVYFDLIGLPPAAKELEAQESYEAVVDKLLASPRFGERWARHWLDLVRYAESRGHEFDYDIPNAFEYRDYVIRALNADVPYDEFVIEHVAGDLLEQPRLHPKEGWNESIIGTGFWFLGEWCHSPVDIRKDECDRIDNMLDVFSKTFLGVTLACARCHDHKFDAISQRDYYALAGYLQSSSYRLARFETWEQDRKIASELTALDAKYRAKIAAAVASALRPKLDTLAADMAASLEKLRDELGVAECDLKGGEVIADYGNLPSDAWRTNGPTFGRSPVPAGQLVLGNDPAIPLEVATYGSARRDARWGDLGLSETSENDPARLAGWLRAGRTLKTPTFTLKSGSVHYLIEGVGQIYAAVDSHVMINGPLHAELLKDTGGNADLPVRWITHDLSPYTGHRVHLEFSPKEDEDFRVLMVDQGNERPAAPRNRSNRLLAQSDSAACRKLIAETIDRLEADQFTSEQHAEDWAAIANWLISQSGADPRTDEVAKLFDAYQKERGQLTSAIRSDSRLCMALWDGSPVDEHLLIRGNHKTVGGVVPRRMLEAVKEAGARSQEPAGSGRLELARQLIDRGNPLVSRVIVNRVWQHLMGRGIAPSVDNFGVLGQPPTHPDLLDHLAEEFVRDSWSLKRLIRRIVLSSTYRQESGASGQKSEAVDPQNLLFHRQNIQRLEGEAIRDAILAVSGRLDETMYGPSVPVFLTSFMQGRGRPKESGPLDGNKRRSIYVAVRRNFLSPMMLAFDTPIPFTTIGRRNVSNVPAQALILMNDSFVGEQARLWAKGLLANGSSSPDDRIRQMYLAAFSRDATTAETAAAIEFLAEQARGYGIPREQAMTDSRTWADLGHVLFNVKEFVFVE